MRFVIEQIEDGSHELTVSDLSDEEEKAFEDDPEVLVVGLERKGELYRRIFPRGTSYLEISIENLRHLYREVLDQASPTGTPDWQRAVDVVIQRLAGTGIEWMFIGGAALAVQGVRITPGDIDVITDVAGAQAMNDLFSDCLITPAAPIPDWGYFGRAFSGAKIEWAGNDPGQNPQMWHLSAPQRTVSWRGNEVRVALLETYLKIERHRDRADRVAAIEEALSAVEEPG